MNENRIVIDTTSESPLNNKEYRLKYGYIHDVISQSLRILRRKNLIDKFHSRPDLTFSDTLLSHVHSKLTVSEFVEILSHLPSYFAVIVNERITVIIRDIDVIDNSLKVIVSKLRSWEEFRRCFLESNMHIEFRDQIYIISIFDIICIYCLGHPLLARYSGVVDNINYKGNEFLNLWSDYIDTNLLEDNTIPEVNEVITNYIYERLSQNQVDIYNYIIMWFASMVLNPHKKTCISPIFVNEDPRKSIFVFLGKHVFKHRYRKINKLEDLTGKENHKLIASSLVLCNEFKSKHEFTANLDVMKPFVTESMFDIQHTNFSVGSVINFVIFTDDINIKGNKYHPVFDVTPSTTNIFDSLTEADAYNFVKWLTYVDLTGFDIEDAPNNHKVVEKSTETNLEDILHSLHIDNIDVDPATPSYGIKFKHVYERYIHVCKYHLRRPPSSRNVFYTDIRRYYSKDNNNAYIAEEHGHNGWYLKQNKSYKVGSIKSIPIMIKKQ